MSELVYTVIESLEVLRALQPAIEELGKNVAEENPFFLPFILFPWLRHCGTGQERFLICRTQDGELVGFFPFEMTKNKFGIPFKCIAVLKTPYLFLTTPLVARGFEEAFARSLNTWLKSCDDGGIGLYLEGMATDGSVYNALHSVFGGRGTRWSERDVHNRCILRKGLPYPEFEARAISKKHRKDIEKKRARLSEAVGGAITLTLHSGAENAVLASFIEMECAGWKGREGSAIGCDTGLKGFLQSMSESAGGSVEIYRLGTPERAVALMVVVRGQHTQFGYKIAFDETLDRFSPGLLLLLEMTKMLLGHESFVLFDSCAAPGSALFERNWLDHRRIGNIFIGNGSLVSRMVLGLVSCGREVRRRAKGAGPTLANGVEAHA